MDTGRASETRSGPWRAHVCAIAAAVCSAFGAACSRGYEVVVEAPDDPLRDVRTFALAGVAYSELQIGDATEADWLATRDPVERARFANDKTGFADRFSRALRDLAANWSVNVLPPDGALRRHALAPFIIRPFVSELDPGHFDYATGRPSHVVMTVYVSTADGGVVDAITLEHDTPAGNFNASTTGRLSDDATALATRVADFVRRRVAGDE